MVKLSIFWTKTAIRQRNATFDYWNRRNHSNSYSKKLNSSIKERVNLLRINPEMGKPTDFEETRAISLGHYSILYKKVGHNLYITGFWDNRQNPKKLIKFLKNN